MGVLRSVTIALITMPLVIVNMLELNDAFDAEWLHGKGPFPSGKACRMRGHIEDVTIIGAGIGGTYTAYKLRDKNLRIGLFEMASRVGGRYYTRRLRKIPDINIELGAMRYKPEKHKRLHSLLQELGLPIVNFEQKFRVPSKSMCYVRGKHIPYAKLGTPGYLPYNVKPSERLSRNQLKFQLFKNNTNTTNNSEPLYTLVTNDGIPLYKQSRRQVASKTSSNEAYLYLKDTGGLYSSYDDAIGLYARKNKPIDKPFPDFGLPDVKTVGTGFTSVAKTLLRRFLETSNKHIFKRNHRLEQIETISGGIIKLKFRRTHTKNGITTLDRQKTTVVYTRRVVLCLPKEPLQLIKWKPLQNTDVNRYLLNAVFPNQASKIFLGYSYPWWTRLAGNLSFVVTDVPVRQMYDWKTSNTTGKAVLLASYTDSSGTLLWRRLWGRGNVVGGANDVTDVTEEVIKQVHIDLAAIFNVSVDSIPYPIDGAMFVFDRYPFNGGWHIPTPGYKLEKIRFSLVKPSCQENVFIASSSYTLHKFKGWSEGSLVSSDEVLKVLFKKIDMNLYPCNNF